LIKEFKRGVGVANFVPEVVRDAAIRVNIEEILA